MEIERKFLVHREIWEQQIKPVPKIIKQGYLSTTPECTVRVRTKNDQGFITIKGKTVGISREEFEYEIPIDEATQLLEQFTTKSIFKKRYEIDYKGKTWELDEFEGRHAPLILAEIELNSEDEEFELPSWIAEEVSDDPAYFNSNLVQL